MTGDSICQILIMTQSLLANVQLPLFFTSSAPGSWPAEHTWTVEFLQLSFVLSHQQLAHASANEQLLWAFSWVFFVGLCSAKRNTFLRSLYILGFCEALMKTRSKGIRAHFRGAVSCAGCSWDTALNPACQPGP